MKRLIYVLAGCFLYIGIFSFIFPRYMVLADTVKEEYEDLNESIEDEPIVEENNDQVLSDNIGFIFDKEEENIVEVDVEEDLEEDLEEKDKGFSDIESKKALVPLRSSTPHNSYDDSKAWLFDENLYKTSGSLTYWYFNNRNGGTDIAQAQAYIFKFDEFGIHTDEYVMLFADNNNYVVNIYSQCLVVYQVNTQSVVCPYRYYGKTGSQQGYVNSYLNNYGFPSDMGNVYWDDPNEITPTPTPDPSDPTITPTPDPDGGDIMYNPNFEILVIFCFGLLAGIVAGRLLLGFIK